MTKKVKINFAIGEKVLCYEPDPSKAKVLYDSKILQVNITQDSNGRRVPEYLIHFLGWSNNWDRIVNENFILADTDENRSLQEKLATAAGVSLKRKWRGSFPFKSFKAKTTLTRKENEEQTDLNSNNDKIQGKESTSESDMSDEDTERVIEIPIPESLEDILHKDCEFVTEKKKLIELPCQENIISILESYVKHMATKLLCPQKSVRSTRKKIFNDVESEINFYKEVADGIRIYFDFTLQHLLLYRQEMKQFENIKKSFIVKEEVKVEDKNFDENTKKETPDKYSFRQRKCKSMIQKFPSPNENGAAEMPKLEECPVILPSKIVSRRSKKPKISEIRQCLRSAHKTVPLENVRDNCAASEFCKDDNSTSNHQEINVSQNQILRTALTSPPHLSLFSKNVHQTACNNYSSSSNSNTPPSSPPLMDPCCVLISRMEDSPQLSTVDSGLLRDILKWKIVPEKDIPKDKEPEPSFIYGAHHLLRLFVKFPELLCKIHMPNRKLDQLVIALEEFLLYLSQKKNDFFTCDHCIDADDK